MGLPGPIYPAPLPMYLFIDTETRSPCDLKKHGAYNYAHDSNTDVLMWIWALDDGPVKIWWPDKWYDNTDAAELSELQKMAEDPEVIFVAHNSFFDRHIWHQISPRYGLPDVPLERWLCSQVQAEASCLPGGLDKAAKQLRLDNRKRDGDGRLKKLLCGGDPWTDKHRKAMPAFIEYGKYDVLTHRELFQKTRPLNAQEWSEFHDSETINDTGLPIHRSFCLAAAKFFNEEKKDLRVEFEKLTGDFFTSKNPKANPVFMHRKKPLYIDTKLAGNFSDTAARIREATIVYDKKKKQQKRSFGEDVRDEVAEILNEPSAAEDLGVELHDHLISFVDLCGSGGTTSAKFQKMADLSIYDVCIHGTYVFNGAGQTGRYSSRGAQMHNHKRDVLDKDPTEIIRVQDNMIAAVRDGEIADEAHHLRLEHGPIQRVLGRMVRSAVMTHTPETHVILSVDMKQGEARVCPWLSERAPHILDMFTSGVDFYTQIASELMGRQCTKEERQMGKINHLASQFGGGKGALMGAAKSYGLKLTPEEAQQHVYNWRAKHPWSQAYCADLKEAAFDAMDNAGTWYTAGKVRYLFHRQLMGGTLLCQLPSQRFILYRGAKLGEKQWDDGRTTPSITYLKPTGFRNHLWHGIQIENITQAYQADLLRYYIKLCLQAGLKVVGHTHDEILLEVEKAILDDVVKQVLSMFETVPSHAQGLPMQGESTIAPFYHK